jgi:glutamate---cysteine ligase / carboxylate-amine ligase
MSISITSPALRATFDAAESLTIGVEEEVMLLDARTGSIANRIEDVRAVLPPELARHASAETHACVLELKTTAHATVAGVAAELAALRPALDGVLRDELGLRAAAAGTHPLATRSEVAVTADPRHREIVETMGALARREPTMALHVHVAVPDAAAAVRALDGLRGDLPLLLALSANSPFWRGCDSGFAAMRSPIFSMFPRVGIPRRFGSYARYAAAVDRLVSSVAIRDPSFLWWDARLRPHLGTVEVRIMDAQSRAADVGALAALVQCLVRWHAEEGGDLATDAEVLDENRFLAARDGMRARLIDGFALRPRPATAVLAEMLAACRPFAAALGCAAELAAASALAADPGEARQRRVAGREGLGELPVRLSAEFAAVGVLAAA